MKIYRERETEHHFIFEVRPHQLFDLETSNESALHPERRESSVSALNINTGRRELLALAKHKRMGADLARRLVANLPEELAFADDSARTEALT